MNGRSIAIGLAVLLPVAGVAAAVAVGGGGDDKPAVLRVLDNGSGGGAETALAPAADSDKRSAAAGMMMAYVTYEAGPDLPALEGNARAYRVVSRADPAVVATQVAKAYGVAGTPEERDGTWIVSDGSHEVSVYPGNGTQWSVYSSAPVFAEGDVTSRSAEECKAGGVCASPPEDAEYVEPTRPANLPTKAEAEQIALDFLDEVGVDTAGAHVQVDDGITQWSVSVDPVVGGARTVGLGSYIGVGDKGVIEYASGTLATYEEADEYDLIGTRAAIDKLNAQTSAYATGGGDDTTLEAPSATGTATGTATPAVAPDTPVCDSEPCDTGTANVTDPSCAADACSTPGFAGGGSTGSGSAGVAPAPLPADSEPVPPPEPTVVTLTDAEVGLLYYPVFDEKGGSSDGWLVPAYVFTAEGETAGYYTAVAIADEYLVPITPTGRNAVDVGTPVDSGPATKTDD